LQQRGGCGGGAARHRDVGGSMAAARQWREREARRRRTARRQQRGRRNTEAAADSPAPSANAPTHAPSDAQTRVGMSKHTDSYIRTNNRLVKKELQIFAILVAGMVAGVILAALG
jgi:sRNA-binding protein